MVDRALLARDAHASHVRRQRSRRARRALDVLRAAFPAGTLSGAPKIRAMEIIEELEPTRRGVYGGAVGYFCYTGNMDLPSRSARWSPRATRIYVQAGAGIVADSVPSAEYEECREQGARGAARGRDGAADARRRRGSCMLLVIDNYDSFTYNLVQYLGELGAEVRRRAQRRDHRRRDRASCAPSAIVISPGPCTPNEAGISLD